MTASVSVQSRQTTYEHAARVAASFWPVPAAQAWMLGPRSDRPHCAWATEALAFRGTRRSPLQGPRRWQQGWTSCRWPASGAGARLPSAQCPVRSRWSGRGSGITRRTNPRDGQGAWRISAASPTAPSSAPRPRWKRSESPRRGTAESRDNREALRRRTGRCRCRPTQARDRMSRTGFGRRNMPTSTRQ